MKIDCERPDEGGIKQSPLAGALLSFPGQGGRRRSSEGVRVALDQGPHSSGPPSASSRPSEQKRVAGLRQDGDDGLSNVLRNAVKKLRVGAPADKAVLLELADSTNDFDGLCCPSVKKIALATELSDRSVQRALGRLEAAGYLRIVRRTRRSHHYVLEVEGVTVSPKGVTVSPPPGVTVSPLISKIETINNLKISEPVEKRVLAERKEPHRAGLRPILEGLDAWRRRKANG